MAGPGSHRAARVRVLWRDKWLMCAAMLLLGRAWLHLMLRGFGDVPSRLVRRGAPAPAALCARVGGAVWLASRIWPPANCLAQAMAAQALLALRGFGSDIVIGVRMGENGQLQAHAWLTSGGHPVIGQGPGVANYREIIGGGTC